MVAKLADLGVARIVDIQPDQLAATMTRAPGTAVYMPPEALEPNARYDTTIDVFSFGNLALYTLTQIFPDLKRSNLCQFRWLSCCSNRSRTSYCLH